MDRRQFLKKSAILMAGMVALPVPVFVPPREPFVYITPGLDGLYSHLGILPSTKELSVCEGRLLEIGDWDGTGYPCLVENACSFSRVPQRAWIYDFDLWNFRHVDTFGMLLSDPFGLQFPNLSTWFAHR